jgi:acyl-CoA thioester hydrolase
MPEAAMTGEWHRHAVRVYWEDTDASGIVFYANYLRFTERGRTEWLRRLGIDQSKLLTETGTAFVVRHVSVGYRAPARLDDVLEVQSRLTELRPASLTLEQRIHRGKELLVQSSVQLACIDRQGRPTRLPSTVRHALGVAVPDSIPPQS